MLSYSFDRRINYLLIDSLHFPPFQTVLSSVDAYTVKHAVDVLKMSILPHSLQFLSILDTRSSYQRTQLTADDIIGPLDMLFEFGAINSKYIDPSLRPVVLFGQDTQLLGSPLLLDTHSDIGR